MSKDLFISVPTKFGDITSISTDDRITADLIKHSIWEEIELNNCISLYKKYQRNNHNIILDIGANIGSYSIPFAWQFPDHTIYTFECQKIMYECLLDTRDRLNIHNLKIHHAAVSNTNDDNFYYNMIDYTQDANFGAFELEPPKENTDFNGVITSNLEHVKKITIDSLNLTNVGLIKIDVEGMEINVLEGAINTITESTPLIAVEFGKTSIDTITKFFCDLNYKNISRDRSLLYFAWNK